MGNDYHEEGVASLIRIERNTSAGNKTNLVAIEALGRAGGATAAAHLAHIIGVATTGTERHLIAVKALGEALRVNFYR